MTRLFDLLVKGGPLMIPIVGLSIVAMAYALERMVFWVRLLGGEKRVVQSVLEAARFNLHDAEAIAKKAQGLAIGRFLLAPLKLKSPSPETFHLALDAAAGREFAAIRRGNQLFESVATLTPLLGLLGTAIGLILTLNNLGFTSGQPVDIAQIAAKVAEALIPTVVGLAVAIFTLTSLRVLAALQTREINYFSKVGTELELIYRQVWYEPSQQPKITADPSLPTTDEPARS